MTGALRRAALYGGLAGALACAPAAEHPDVLLVVVDTLRADHLGVYGHPGDITPGIDALAARCVVFDRAIAASTRTAPSHASMMTSLRVREHSIGSVNGATRLGDERTLATAFREAGYRTAAFVSNYVLNRRVGLDAGFDVYDDEMTARESNRADWYWRPAPETAAHAIAWLERERSGPRFLFVHFMEPHGPYEPPPGWAERFLGAPDPDEPELPVLATQEGWKGIPAYQALPGERRPSRYRARYAGEVAFVDGWVERVVASAERAAGARGLVVLFTADHGEALGEEDFWFVHGNVTWPTVSRVPFVLCAPGLAPGRRGDLVHHVDVLPTLLTLAGLPVPADARGLDLSAYLHSGEPLPDRTLFSDIGEEVGVFRGDVYQRVQRSPDGRIHWSSYRWRPGGGWRRAPADPHQRAEVLAYVREARPLLHTTPPSDDDLERLRALGYVEPEDAGAAASRGPGPGAAASPAPSPRPPAASPRATAR